MHHERCDGQGFPDGLRSEAIPLPARLFAVVDVFDALTHARSYRAVLSVPEALALIDAETGGHFDPEVVQAFWDCFPAQRQTTPRPRFEAPPKKPVLCAFLTVQSGTLAPRLGSMLRVMSLAAFLDLRGEAALVVGGGPVALRRARTLLEAGLDVTVVAPDLHPDLAALPLRAERRPYRPEDVWEKRVVVAATDQAALNDAVVAAARAAGALVNHAGDAERSTLRFPAVVRRGGVQVAVSSGHELPLLAQALAERIAALLPESDTVAAWVARRERALTLDPAAREDALAGLRAEIRTALGLPTLGGAA